MLSRRVLDVLRRVQWLPVLAVALVAWAVILMVIDHRQLATAVILVMGSLVLAVLTLTEMVRRR